MPKFLSVKNYERYQHYKHRNPPWIKLYYDLLDDDGFISLSNSSKLTYILMLLIAGRQNNHINSDPDYLRKVMRLDQSPDISELIQKKFLLASGYHRAITKLSIKHENRAQSISSSETEYSSSETEAAKGPPASVISEAETILNFLSEKTGRVFRSRMPNGKPTGNLEFIIARLKDGADVQTCRSLIAKKVRDWKGDPKMQAYLRPETLFNRTKFESYLAEVTPCPTAQTVTES